MATARHGEKTYTVELAETVADRMAVYDLRADAYAATQPYLLSPEGRSGLHRAADAYDARSYVFACRSQGEREPVATCRFTVPLRGRFELDDLVTAWTLPAVPAHALVETSRVLVRPGWRATGLVEAMLLMAGTWLLEQTSFRYNFAVCTRPLVRLYARLGMKRASDEELTLRGRPTDRRYVVIYGDMETSRPAVLRRLATQGWDISTIRHQQRKAGT